MNNSLISLGKSMGISADAIRMALGQMPDLSRRLEDIKTFEEGAEMLELTKKDYREVHFATISKMISFIRDAATLYEFMKVIWKYSITKDQRSLLPAIFDAYGNDLIKSIVTVSGLRNLRTSYEKCLNDTLQEKIRYKILLLEAERIISFETVDQCYDKYHSVGPDFQRLMAARADSLLLPLLKEVDSVEKAEAFLRKPFLTDEMRGKAEELYKQLVRKRINDRSTEWKMLKDAFYVATNQMPWHTLARRALIRMARRADSEAELQDVIQIICRSGTRSNEQIYKDTCNKYDTIVEAQILGTQTVDGCFMVHGGSVTKSKRLKLATVNRTLKLATTVEDYLSIVNLAGRWEPFEGFNVNETVDYCMNAALYLTSSMNEWNKVWCSCKQKLGEFGQKCLRRFAIIAEAEKGIWPEPIVDGLYVLDLKDAA